MCENTPPLPQLVYHGVKMTLIEKKLQQRRPCALCKMGLDNNTFWETSFPYFGQHTCSFLSL